MRICVIGTGYVGLVTGTCLAETGHSVICVDHDSAKILRLSNGNIPIYEPGLEELVKRNLQQKRLYFTTQYGDAIPNSEIVFITVGTPSDSTGKTDLTHIDDVTTQIAKHMTDYLIIACKSTVPTHTCERIRSRIQETLDNDIQFDIVSNPEFLKEGNSINDFMRPDRIIIGSDNDKSREIMHKLYKPFVLNSHPIIDMDIVSAELTKYAANAMLATRISFMNEIANLCDELGANINHVRRGLGSDPRIGSQFLFPGIGYGGDCFPKDISSLITVGEQYGHDLKIIKAVESVNHLQKTKIFNKINRHFKTSLSGKHFAIWGLSFKPQTDDIRESPSLTTIDLLLESGARLSVYDPVALDNVRKFYGNKLDYMNSPYDHLETVSAILIMTEWSEFRAIDSTKLKSLMTYPLIFDGRNLFKSDEMESEGIEYYGIGQGQNS